ncbi:MAG: hypothetical protein NC931_02960 [Candidatus Omnitrophica bacterium]|nr:hypothetical protein [Candidatus Omnitrophota bacterium]
MRKGRIVILGILSLIMMVVCGCGKKRSELEEKVKETGVKTLQKFKRTAHQDNLMYLKNKLNTYKRQNGKYPDSLQQLVNEGFIDKIPEPPAGMHYDYDPATGRLSLK